MPFNIPAWNDIKTRAESRMSARPCSSTLLLNALADVVGDALRNGRIKVAEDDYRVSRIPVHVELRVHAGRSAAVADHSFAINRRHKEAVRILVRRVRICLWSSDGLSQFGVHQLVCLQCLVELQQVGRGGVATAGGTSHQRKSAVVAYELI